MNRELTSKDDLTNLIHSIGIQTWDELVEFVRTLPYNRNSNRVDFELVIKEKRGTCSSKHALLKKAADLNDIPKVKLILGMYKMGKNNTPGIGNILLKNSMNYLPEAHCYLSIDGERMDVTTPLSDFENLSNDIIQEIEIQPEQVAQFKVEYHKEFIKNWIAENGILKDFDEIWKIREMCIANLSSDAKL